MATCPSGGAGRDRSRGLATGSGRSAAGLLPTVLILLVEAVVGVLLMRHEGSRAWKALNDAFTKGKVPTGELADAALILVGGVLLMLPGFLTDIIGSCSCCAGLGRLLAR